MRLEPGGEKTAVCAHCGETTHTVWGFVSDEQGARCAYFVNWGGSHVPHLALGWGAWGDGTTAADRRSIYAELADGAWRFVDHAAPGAPASQEETLGRGLRASGVERDPQREEVVETLEFIVRNDDRLQRLGVSSRLG